MMILFSIILMGVLHGIHNELPFLDNWTGVLFRVGLLSMLVIVLYLWYPKTLTERVHFFSKTLPRIIKWTVLAYLLVLFVLNRIQGVVSFIGSYYLFEVDGIMLVHFIILINMLLVALVSLSFKNVRDVPKLLKLVTERVKGMGEAIQIAMVSDANVAYLYLVFLVTAVFTRVFMVMYDTNTLPLIHVDIATHISEYTIKYTDSLNPYQVARCALFPLLIINQVLAIRGYLGQRNNLLWKVLEKIYNFFK